MIAVFSGHHIPIQVSHRIDEGVHGNKVVQLFQNWQSAELGGSGRFRIVSYDTVSRLLDVRVFNPQSEQFETDLGYELIQSL